MERPTGYVCAGLSGCGLADAVLGNESFGLGETGRDARRGDGLAALDLAGSSQVRGEELGEQISLGAETVGGENGGIQGGVSVFEGIGARAPPGFGSNLSADKGQS